MKLLWEGMHWVGSGHSFDDSIIPTVDSSFMNEPPLIHSNVLTVNEFIACSTECMKPATMNLGGGC